MNDAAPSLASRLYAWLTTPLFTLGGADVSAAGVLKFLVFVAIVFWLGLKLRRALRRRILPRLQVDPGVADTLSNIAGWTAIGVGILVALQTIGLKLSTLNVVFGALGIGVGFGLQTVVSNFVAGIIILVERPIQIGDRIQLGELHGRVARIRFRATEVITNDNIAFIVPNSEFIAQQVINWSRGGNRIRVRIPVHVAYGSDPEVVRRALLDAADQLDVVLKEPKPEVRLTAFGESSLQFELLGWTSEMLQRRGAFISRVNFAILGSLSRHGIAIPFPQRDVTVRWSGSTEGPFPVE
jgi:small-conductance mechanosensitive channel